MRIAIYPGTFDPITYGHLDVIARAAELFDRVIVAVAENTAKRPLFSDEERVAMIRQAVRKHKNVSVDCFEGLLVNYARRKKAVSDFEYEFQMALTNRKLAGGISTVFLMPHEKYTYLNSSIVREIALFGGDVRMFVPPQVRKSLLRKIALLKSGA
jgi:pantetheine-phosphate adenylyltransferase